MGQDRVMVRELELVVDLVLVKAKDRAMANAKVRVMGTDTNMGMDMDTNMDTDKNMGMDTNMGMDMDHVMERAMAINTSMVTSMASATRKERTVTGPPAAPAAATRTR
ncbi:uncharacterized protein [Pseudochaenichthys georgianus]|uniref:uncharacterized protein isoform X2 n=1 Tax=Pseudochaenichthys georgianus TaxID=52239 RepID=UPI00146AC958|nr:uncharacterized protein LOC117466253 isoform X2 [Pseudochaenichthys georgianus]XP_033965300.1 uncharacterized protein LOC117466262 isoform X2 [Pseudochaenichthys georgianus]